MRVGEVLDAELRHPVGRDRPRPCVLARRVASRRRRRSTTRTRRRPGRRAAPRPRTGGRSRGRCARRSPRTRARSSRGRRAGPPGGRRRRRPRGAGRGRRVTRSASSTSSSRAFSRLRAGVVVVRERVDADDLVPGGGERSREVRADEARGAGDDVAHGQASPGSAAIGYGQLLGERHERTALVLDEAEVGEEAGHHDALAELAEARLGPLAAGERERELRVAAARRERQREGAAEAGVDVGDRQRAVGLAEALHVRRPDDPDRLGDVRPVLDQLTVGEGAPLDRLAALRLDHRARDRVEAAALDVAEHVDRELLPEAALLHHGLDGRRGEVERELLGAVGTVDVPRAEALAHLDEHRVAHVVRHVCREATSAGSGSRARRRTRARGTCRPWPCTRPGSARGRARARARRARPRRSPGRGR